MSRCVKCGKELNPIDVGLSKKLINRGATEFLCKACLAEKFAVTEALLDEKVRAFRAAGCVLFPPDDKE